MKHLDYVWVSALVVVVSLVALWYFFPKQTKETNQPTISQQGYIWPDELKDCKEFRVKSKNFGENSLLVVRCSSSQTTLVVPSM